MLAEEQGDIEGVNICCNFHQVYSTPMAPFSSWMVALGYVQLIYYPPTTRLLPRQYTRSYKVSTVSFASVLSAFCRDLLPVPLAGRFIVDAWALYVSLWFLTKLVASAILA